MMTLVDPGSLFTGFPAGQSRDEMDTHQLFTQRLGSLVPNLILSSRVPSAIHPQSSSIHQASYLVCANLGFPNCNQSIIALTSKSGGED